MEPQEAVFENEWNIGSLVDPGSTRVERPKFDFTILTPEHLQIALTVLGSTKRLAEFDAAIASADAGPDGGNLIHLYRWHVIARNNFGGTYFHIQVADDDDSRGYHDHPYDSMSIHLANGHVEVNFNPARAITGDQEWQRDYRAGEVRFRKAEELHRLRLRPGQLYSMTLFSHGPRRRPDWGFQEPGQAWVPATHNAEIVNGVAVSRGRSHV